MEATLRRRLRRLKERAALERWQRCSIEERAPGSIKRLLDRSAQQAKKYAQILGQDLKRRLADIRELDETQERKQAWRKDFEQAYQRALLKEERHLQQLLGELGPRLRSK